MKKINRMLTIILVILLGLIFFSLPVSETVVYMEPTEDIKIRMTKERLQRFSLFRFKTGKYNKSF